MAHPVFPGLLYPCPILFFWGQFHTCIKLFYTSCSGFFVALLTPSLIKIACMSMAWVFTYFYWIMSNVPVSTQWKKKMTSPSLPPQALIANSLLGRGRCSEPLPHSWWNVDVLHLVQLWVPECRGHALSRCSFSTHLLVKSFTLFPPLKP